MHRDVTIESFCRGLSNKKHKYTIPTKQITVKLYKCQNLNKFSFKDFGNLIFLVGICGPGPGSSGWEQLTIFWFLLKTFKHFW